MATFQDTFNLIFVFWRNWKPPSFCWKLWPRNVCGISVVGGNEMKWNENWILIWKKKEVEIEIKVSQWHFERERCSSSSHRNMFLAVSWTWLRPFMGSRWITAAPYPYLFPHLDSHFIDFSSFVCVYYWHQTWTPPSMPNLQECYRLSLFWGVVLVVKMHRGMNSLLIKCLIKCLFAWLPLGSFTN